MNHTCTTIISFVLLALSANAVYAQFQGDVYRQYTHAKVINGATTLQLPWTGGVNNPQLAMADLNKDGLDDLVIYEDYIGLTTYIATSPGNYTYDPYYEQHFPPINSYIKFLDFNRDNIPDLIHRGGSGVSVNYGYYDNNELKFKHYKVLLYENGPGNWTNINAGPETIPGMGDVDGDGDIDILTYNWSGSQITYYRNCQVEDNLPVDSIKICIKEACWGRTLQLSERQHVMGLPLCSATLVDPITCKGCPPPAHKNTGGVSSLCLFDIDSDGDQDYFNGHQSFTDIQFFVNGKSQYGVDSMISEDTIWGANNVPMIMHNYPAAFVVDIDHDNDDDLVFTPLDQNSENYRSMSFYENTTNNTNRNFVFKSNTHLVDRMIDMGVGSYPVFYDFDKDGRKDLFIGSEGFRDRATFKNFSKIAYYRNTSTQNSFSFELQTDDFLGLSALNFEGAALAMGDIDNDTLDDLVIGRTDGTFAFFKNHAAHDTLSPVWKLEENEIKDATTGIVLDVGDYATPCIYDIDNNGYNDLISGGWYGDLFYFNNIGTTPGVLSMKFITQNLGGVKLQNINASYTHSVPYIGPTDDTEIDYLVIGCQWGQLYRFDGFQNGAMPAKYTMIDSVYSYVKVGRRSAPAFANVDNDSAHLHEMVIGNSLGGLRFYKQDFKVTITDKVLGSRDVSVYPNPASGILNVKWGNSFNEGTIRVLLYSVTGAVMMQREFTGQTVSCILDLPDIASGTYFCVVQSATNKSIQQVNILK